MTRKEKYQLLRKAGFTAKEAQKYRSYSESNVLKKVKNKERSVKRQAKQKALIVAGYTKKEAIKMQDYGEKRIEQAIRLKQEKLFLIVGYKDVTETTDSEALYTVKQNNKKRSRKRLIDSIMGWLEAGENQGFIGGYEMIVTDTPEQAKSFLHAKGYLTAYCGKGYDLNKLLGLLDSMMILLYTMEEKDSFIQDLVKNLNELPYEKARQNASFIQENFLVETGDHF